MPTLQNAAVIEATGSISLQKVPIPEPRPGEILVQVIAVAQNPSDWMVLRDGKATGRVDGCDFAGIVQRVGDDVTPDVIVVGERVAGFVHGGMNGAFREYLTTSADLVVRIPDSWSFDDASQLGQAPLTALQTLYQSLPSIPLPGSAPSTDTSILIYGASSSIGVFAVQFSKLAGLRVIATASQANFDLVKSLGADDVFDYKHPGVAQQIKDATQGGLKLAFDCISQGGSAKLISDALSDDGGAVGATLPYDSPRQGVSVGFHLVHEWLGKDFEVPWPYKATAEQAERGRFFTKVISNLVSAGKIKPGPVRLMPNGLAGIPEGIQYMLDGKVSGQKLVYRVGDTPADSA